MEKSYSPMTIRFFILQAHYRSTIDFGNEALQGAEKGVSKLMSAMETLQKIVPSKSSTYNVSELESKCYSAMDDDFNTPILIAHLFDGVRIINSVKDGKESLSSSDLEKLKTLFNTFVTDILGLISAKNNTSNDLTNEVMDLVLKLRDNAKSSKDFTTADLIREELNKLNIQFNDRRDGSNWKLNT